MSDKERILLWLVNRMYADFLFHPEKRNEWLNNQPNLYSENRLNPGDLVTTATTVEPNEFIVGFVHQVISSDRVIIREIGSNRLCDYKNESFRRIDKDLLGYEILEGVQYEIYRKVLKAFFKSKRLGICFQSINFDGNVCRVEARKRFSDETMCTITFKYNKNTSIKSIVELLNSTVMDVGIDERRDLNQ